MEQIKITPEDTIAAISTPNGIGGVAIIRISGNEALSILKGAWEGADLLNVPSHTVHLGRYVGIEGNLIDECVATIFRAPKSFTGEDVVELGVHGSSWIQKEILADLVRRGARIAEPGEFTKRAFLNGKLDLAQAEGVADLIAASSKAAHNMAINQTRGKFSQEFRNLREKLIEFASLLELELDFAEEEVEFADRAALSRLLREILTKVNSLADSYHKGAVLKNGVPVVIAGVPNAGKSSLLNLLLNDDKAIVTDIPGTTRDTIEDTVEIDGVLFRFIDTAGLRETSDTVESIGVDRAWKILSKASVVIWLFDPTQNTTSQIDSFTRFIKENPEKPIIILINKSDLTDTETLGSFIRTLYPYVSSNRVFPFSTHTKQGLSQLEKLLVELAVDDTDLERDILVTNARHYQALMKSSQALTLALQALKEGIPSDLVAQDIREATAHLSTITGEITTDNLLHSIFSRFCIGK